MVIRQEKQSQSLSVSYLPAVSGSMLGCCGATRRRLANVGKSPICFKHSRGGPIAAQTTGDRKEKSDDHKEDLRQKPHDRRRQSTYLHAVPERRCPSMAGS